MNSPTNLKPLSWMRSGDCIICTSHAPDTHGYPCMRRNGGKYRRIARWILLKRHGDLPPSIVTRHTCGNRKCISPNHIVKGSVADNNRDTVEHGRNCGETASGAKLTEADVILIRSLPFPIVTIAKMFCMKPSYISDIIHRRYWKHI